MSHVVALPALCALQLQMFARIALIKSISVCHHVRILSSLWTPAQRKRASMLYFGNVFIYLFFYGRLILRPWLTEVRESFTRGGP